MLLRYSPILLYLSRRDLSSADSEKSVETLFPREDGAEGGVAEALNSAGVNEIFKEENKECLK